MKQISSIWKIIGISSLSVVAVGGIVATICLAAKAHYFYDLRLTQDSERRLFHGLITNSSYAVVGEIISNDKNYEDKISSWQFSFLSSHNGVDYVQDNSEGNVFNINVGSPTSFINNKVNIKAKISAHMKSKVLNYKFSFDVFSNQYAYEATTNLSILSNGTSETFEYRTANLSTIGNIPTYVLKTVGMTKEGAQFNDWVPRFESHDTNVIRIVQSSSDSKEVNLQIIDKGSSVISVDYLDNLGRIILHISRNWTFNEDDMKDQTVFTNKIIKSSYWGTDVSSLHHVVRKTDFATITLMNLNSIDTSWSTDFAEKWRFTFHSNDDRAWINYSEEEWTALHKIGFGCSAFRTDMWVWISAQTPNGIQYIMEDANDNAPDTGGWQVYDS